MGTLHLWLLCANAILLRTCFAYTLKTLKEPHNDCPENFNYVIQDDIRYGIIKLFNVSKETINVDLRMQTRQPIKNDYYGDLILYKDDFKTEEDLINGKPIIYRLNYPLENELPKILAIIYNGNRICSGTAYPDFGSEVTLSHTFFPANIPVELNDNNHIPIHRKPIPKATEVAIAKKEHTVTQPTKRKFVLQTRLDSPISSMECGRVDPIATPFITNGKQLVRGEYPWLIPIFVKEGANLVFICGGSLVSSRTVLTAGHCFKLNKYTAKQVLVFLGRHDLQDFDESGFEIREIEKLVIHPDYREDSIPDADIALMILMTPVRYTKYIKPICLWTEPTDHRAIEGKTGIVTGWGADENGHMTTKPLKVESDIVSEVDCLKNSQVFSKLTSPRTICAGRGEGTGPCMGDSGGGLMIEQDGRWMIRGIVSVGLRTRNKCLNRNYVVYCDVAKHMDWLQKNIVN